MSKTSIIGKSVATAEQMAAFLLSKNPEPKINMPAEELCRLFLYMGAVEGVRGDLLFCQSYKETGIFKFNGTVQPEQNNFAGLGTTDANTPGATFPDEATGILAQAQHAKAYDGAELNFDCVDPRYELLVKYGKTGTAKYWEDLGGKWAVPGYDTEKYASLEEANNAGDSYGYQIVNILEDILNFGKEEEKTEKVEETESAPEMSAKPLAGKRICEDAGHYGKYNRCPAIPAYYESDMAWKLHLMRKKYLEELGAEVVLTRTNQATDKALQARGRTAEGCDLFVSDHSNAAGNVMNESVDYVAVYHLTEDAKADCDDISEKIAKALAPVIANVMGTKQGYKVLTRKSSNDRNGDGVMNDNYYGVLHGARMVDVPGLILEHSFHTNTATVNWLLNNANLDRLAKAEAEAIARYFSGKDVAINDAADSGVPYCIRVANVSAGDVLYIRKEASASSDKTGSLKCDDPNKYTIVEEKMNGETKWGKLKSGIGWINLKYTVKA